MPICPPRPGTRLLVLEPPSDDGRMSLRGRRRASTRACSRLGRPDATGTRPTSGSSPPNPASFVGAYPRTPTTCASPRNGRWAGRSATNSPSRSANCTTASSVAGAPLSKSCRVGYLAQIWPGLFEQGSRFDTWNIRKAAKCKRGGGSRSNDGRNAGGGPQPAGSAGRAPKHTARAGSYGF